MAKLSSALRAEIKKTRKNGGLNKKDEKLSEKVKEISKKDARKLRGLIHGFYDEIDQRVCEDETYGDDPDLVDDVLKDKHIAGHYVAKWAENDYDDVAECEEDYGTDYFFDRWDQTTYLPYLVQKAYLLGVKRGEAER